MKSYSFRTIIEKDGKQYHVPKLPNIKGKQLFMGIRSVLTHQAHGPDLKFIIPLTPIEILENRINLKS